MTSALPIEISCRISSLEEPIRGCLVDEHGKSLDFRGWIELAAGLVALAEGAREPEPFSGPREIQPEQGES